MSFKRQLVALGWLLVLCSSLFISTWAQQAAPVNFAIIGDSGDGSKEQYAIGKRMAEARQAVPFDFVLMLGDNIYGGGKPKYFKPRFEEPYKDLLAAGVKFFPALGNHDVDSVADHLKYPNFNMDGKRFYNYVKGDGLIEFFVLDTNNTEGIATEQLEWLQAALSASTAKWKVAYMHHSLFSSGKMHPPYLKLRNQLHPLFVKHKVDLVLAGHVHAYERVKPQDGVQYITEGCSGKIMRNTLDKKSTLTAFGNDQQQSFMTAQVIEAEIKLEAIGLDGKTIDAFTLKRQQ